MGHFFLDIEKQLVEKLRIGDRDSYKLIFERYYHDLINYIFKISDDFILAEDIVQNVMIRLWEKRSTIIIKSNIKSYLFKSCHNEFLMHLRQKKKEYNLLDELKWNTLYEYYLEDQEHIKEIQLIKVEVAIEKLPLKCREVFKLSRLEQKRHKEIAELLGISTKTVENQITKALRFLKANISPF